MAGKMLSSACAGCFMVRKSFADAEIGGAGQRQHQQQMKQELVEAAACEEEACRVRDWWDGGLLVLGLECGTGGELTMLLWMVRWGTIGRNFGRKLGACTRPMSLMNSRIDVTS